MTTTLLDRGSDRATISKRERAALWSLDFSNSFRSMNWMTMASGPSVASQRRARAGGDLTHGYPVLNTSRDDDIRHLPLRVNILHAVLSVLVHVTRRHAFTFSKLGLTNANHCLITPSMSRPLSRMSRMTVNK